MSYQLCLGDEPIDRLIDRVAASVCEVVPGVPAAACRDLVDLVFRSRVRQTSACGRHDACRPMGSLWGDHAVPSGDVAPAGWHDLDLQVLPRMFAMAAVDLMSLAVDDRRPIEQRVAWAFRRALGASLFVNPSCGHADVCAATPISPFVPLGRTPVRRRGR